MKFVAHRIGDKRVLRLIQKWLNAGVMEDGRWHASTEGTPQGATISPLLANIYLHYVPDLWVHQWRGRHARGDVTFVRYADDFVVGFQFRDDAERFHREVAERQFSGQTHDVAKTDASEAEADKDRTDASPSPPQAHTSARQVVESGRCRLFQLPRGADKLGNTADVSSGNSSALDTSASASRPETTDALAASVPLRRALATSTPSSTSLAFRAASCHYSKQESPVR